MADNVRSSSASNGQRVVLFIGAGIETVPGILRARHLGLFAVASDANPEAPGMALADDRIVASTYDIAATVTAAANYHARRPIAGVLCLATDVPMTVASVAHALGLPGISLESAHLAADKLAMKDRFAECQVPIPWYAPVHDVGALKRIVDKEGFPLVLKPVDSRGARGVLRLQPEMDLDWAFRESRTHSPTGRVMIERYLDGPQISTESLMVHGRCHTPGFADRNYEFLDRFAPHIIENGGQLPSELAPELQQAVRNLVQQAGLAMGIENGVIKGDIVVHDGKPYVIELAARLSGGYFCTHEIPLCTGVDLVGWALRQAVGDVVDEDELRPRFERGVAQRFLFPAPGQVQSIELPDWINNDPEIALCEIRTCPGATIEATISHPARPGVIIATGPDRESAIAKATAAVAAIHIETVP